MKATDFIDLKNFTRIVTVLPKKGAKWHQIYWGRRG
jgi:hypothetical protein